MGEPEGEYPSRKLEVAFATGGKITRLVLGELSGDGGHSAKREKDGPVNGKIAVGYS